MTLNQNNHLTQIYNHADEVIKTAILQGQYEAAKSVNRSQLSTILVSGDMFMLAKEISKA